MPGISSRSSDRSRFACRLRSGVAMLRPKDVGRSGPGRGRGATRGGVPSGSSSQESRFMMVPRRTVLKLASVGVVTAFSGKVARAADAVVTRKSLTHMPLDADDIATYRDFVRLMQGKDQ